MELWVGVDKISHSSIENGVGVGISSDIVHRSVIGEELRKYTDSERSILQNVENENNVIWQNISILS